MVRVCSVMARRCLGLTPALRHWPLPELLRNTSALVDQHFRREAKTMRFARIEEGRGV